MIKLVVICPKVYANEEEANKHMRFMLKSCEIQKIELTTYGFPVSAFPGFIDITTRLQLEFLKTIRNSFSHILYSDGGDAFFTGSLQEIIEKYNQLGNPQMLCATWDRFFPEGPWIEINPEFDYEIQPEEFLNYYYPSSTPFRVPQVGGYIAEIPYLIDTYEEMMNYTHKYGGDNAHIWRDSWIEGWFRPERDLTCQIFQVESKLNCLDIKDNRLHNTITNSFPCILHCNSGYTDPINGKYERIKPFWEMIYPNIEV